ncbi:unnamed protein product [Parascedosporium putredinis]|uniref:Uncharacterized protein n=1 Tax=Parascedosporium putredinis TaxID=1442378 RepID=A0A9P1H0A2_9PEZI|nr:unnamed protein product [Parascedosporium putredinis]CAI7993690.1 unnamed protein product [Parascedosporium putredinis]
MKFSSTILSLSLFSSAFAIPTVQDTRIVKRTADLDELFAQVDAHASAAVNVCIEADVDVSAALEVREAIAAQIQADLEACARLLAEAAAQLKAAAEADVVVGGGASECDRGCAEKVIVDKSKKFCEDVDTVVDRLGEDCVKEQVKPALEAFGDFTVCLDGIFAGVGASVNAVVKSVLGAALSASLGLDLDVLLDIGLGLGGIIGIGRV